MRARPALVGFLSVVVAACGAKLADPSNSISGVDATGSGGADSGGNGGSDAGVADAAVLPDAPPDARVCGGSSDGEGHCFIYHAAAENWASAGSACALDGTHLAIIDNAIQNATVLSIIGTTTAAFIGATDQVTEGTFLWVDGTPLTAFKNFDQGEPNNGNGNYQEDCLVMRVDGAKAGKWDDRPCAIEPGAGSAGVYPFVCEF